MKIQLQITVKVSTSLVDFIAANTELSKSTIKKVLNFGDVWLTQAGAKKPKRIRRATKTLSPGDTVAFYYDAKLLHQTTAKPELVLDTPHWGIWYKPADIPSQGTPFGDLSCMENLVCEKTKLNAVYMVHRLDKEAAGLMLIAYTKPAAAALSELWPSNNIRKFYQARVLGSPSPSCGEIAVALDNKEALSLFDTISTDQNGNALLNVEIKTGRFHQIRRHCVAMGHPVLGDPKYGKGGGKLQLVAVRLVFICPITNQSIDCLLPEPWQLATSTAVTDLN